MTLERMEADDLGGALAPTLLHEQVKERILKRIVLGDWPEGFVLPPETEIARMLSVSFGTIRRAMVDLAKEGVIVWRRRTGTVVTGRSPHHTLARFYRYFRLHSSDGRLINSTARVTRVFRRPADENEARLLRTAGGAMLAGIERQRLIEDRPVMIDQMLIALALVPDFPTVPEQVEPLLYTWLLQTYGLRIAAVRERVTARLAGPEDYPLLDLDPGCPHALLDIDEVAYDAHNEPLLTMRHAALTDHHCYVNEIR